MRYQSIKILAAAVAVAVLASVDAAQAQTVVLVHAALLDGSSWHHVVPILQKAGLKVVAVQNPLTSLADDVAATQRAIDGAQGPVVLVGHSWGGAVITQAGNAAKVRALVYVAAMAPDVGQSVMDLLRGAAATPGGAQIKPDSTGFLSMSSEAFVEDFAPDAPPEEASVLAVSQDPIAGRAFSETVTQAAWRNKPSWYIVAGQDRMMPASLELSMAATIKAKTTTVQGSHALIFSHPKEVATVIIEAAKSLEK